MSHNESQSSAIAQRFKEEIESMDLSINEIARQLGDINHQRIRDVLREKTCLATDLLAKTAVLGVDVKYVVTGKRTVPQITPSERALLENYRSSSKQNKDRLEAPGAETKEQELNATLIGEGSTPQSSP